MKTPLVFIFLFFAMVTNAQDGIRFRSLTWEQALKASEVEAKPIFVDCYTSWCAPCKWMDQNIFILEDIGDFFNANFINVRFDMEKGEGLGLAKKYQVNSFPTYLFVDSKGAVVHRTANKMTKEQFLTDCKTAIKPGATLADLNLKYKDGNRDLSFMLDYYSVLKKTDGVKAKEVGQFITTNIALEQLTTLFGWRTIKELAIGDKDKLGAFYLAHEDQYSKWASETERIELRNSLLINALYSYLYAQNEDTFFDKLTYFKNSPSPKLRKEAVRIESMFYLNTGNTKAYVNLVTKACKDLLKDDADQLIFLTRNAIRNGNNEVLQLAYQMIKRAVEIAPEDYGVQSTYAMVCIALHKKEEGLVAARKALVLSELSTSKIQKIAQGLIDKLELL